MLNSDKTASGASGNNIFDLMENNFSDHHSSSSAGTMMNESPTHKNSIPTGNDDDLCEGASSGGATGDSPSSLVDSAIGGSNSPDDLMQVKSACSSLSDRDEEIFAGDGEVDDGVGCYDDR